MRMGGVSWLTCAVAPVTPLTLSSAVKASLFGIMSWRCLAQSERGIARPRTWHALGGFRQCGNFLLARDSRNRHSLPRPLASQHIAQRPDQNSSFRLCTRPVKSELLGQRFG